MSGRTVAAITQKAKHMQRAAAPKKEPPKAAPVPEKFEMRRPTKAQLMGGHARSARVGQAATAEC